MKYSLQKYLNAGYSPPDAQRELSAIYNNAVASPTVQKVVRVTRQGAIQELNVGQRPQVAGRRYGNS